MKNTQSTYWRLSVGVAAVLCGVMSAEGFVSVSKKTVSAGVSFVGELVIPDHFAPSLTSTPVRRVSPVTKVMRVKGRVADDRALAWVSLDYRTPQAGAWSTLTVTYFDQSESDFSFTVPASSITSAGLVYRLRVRDQSGKETVLPTTGEYPVKVTSEATGYVTARGGTVRLGSGDPDAGETFADFPEGSLCGDENITVRERDPEDPSLPGRGGVVGSAKAAYEVLPAGACVRRPFTLNLTYGGGDVGSGAVSVGGESLGVYFWDGWEWRGRGGVAGRGGKTLSVRVEQAGLYGIFAGASGGLSHLRPGEKVITPGRGDGVNDVAVFGDAGVGSVVEIFDSGGRRVRTLRDRLVWDGRDEAGRLVEGGVYLYQFEANGERVSGTIAVAR